MDVFKGGVGVFTYVCVLAGHSTPHHASLQDHKNIHIVPRPPTSPDRACFFFFFVICSRTKEGVAMCMRLLFGAHFPSGSEADTLLNPSFNLSHLLYLLFHLSALTSSHYKTLLGPLVVQIVHFCIRLLPFPIFTPPLQYHRCTFPFSGLNSQPAPWVPAQSFFSVLVASHND